VQENQFRSTGVIRTIFERIVHASLSLAAVTVLAFGLVRLTGDPVLVYLPFQASQQDYYRLQSQMGLNQSIVVQYWDYLVRLVHGDLGISYQSHVSVSTVLVQRLPATLELGGIAVIVMLVAGITLGTYSAYWQGTPFDWCVRLVAGLGQSAPQFWVGLLLILLVAVRWGLLPAGGYGGAPYVVLPVITIAWPSAAGIARLMRSSMLEVLNTDYISFGRMNGLPEHVILWKHALRNAALPVLTLGGLITAELVTGSIVAETVFDWPGLGQLIINSIDARDFPVIQAAILMYCVVYISLNLSVDLIYVILNPRLRAA
jgi:peptide/nickel transport system permease protein